MPKTKIQVAQQQQQQQQQQMQSVLQAQVSKFASEAFRENGCRVYTTPVDIAIFLLESYKIGEFLAFDQYLSVLNHVDGSKVLDEDLFLIFQQLAHKILGNVQTDMPLPWDEGSLEDQGSRPRADCWFYQLLPLRVPKDDTSVCADLVSFLRHKINVLKISIDTLTSDPQYADHTQDPVGAQIAALDADYAAQMVRLTQLGLQKEVTAIQLTVSASSSQSIINATYAAQSFSGVDGRVDRTLHSFPVGGRGPVSGVDEDFLKHFLMTDQGLLQCMVGLNTAHLPTDVKFCVNPSNKLELSVLTAAQAHVDQAPQAAAGSPVPPVVLCVPDQKIDQGITVQSVFYEFLKKHCYITPTQLMHSLLYPVRSVVRLKAKTQAVEGSDNTASSFFEICSEAVFEEQWALFNQFLGEHDLNFSDLSSDVEVLKAVYRRFENTVFNPQHILCFLMEKFRSPNLKPDDLACQFEEVFSTSDDAAGYVLNHLIQFGGRVLEDQVGVFVSEMGPMLKHDKLSAYHDQQPFFGWSEFLKDAKGYRSANRPLFDTRTREGSSKAQLIARFYICVEMQPPECRMRLSFYRQALDIAFEQSKLLSKHEAFRQKNDVLDSGAGMFNSVLQALGSMLSILAAVSTGPHVKGADPDKLLEKWTSVCKIFSSLDQSPSKIMILQGLRGATVASAICAQISSDDLGLVSELQNHMAEFPEVFDHLFEAYVLKEVAVLLCQPHKTPTACLSIHMLQSILELAQKTFKKTSLNDLMFEHAGISLTRPRDYHINLKAYPLNSPLTQFKTFLRTLSHLPYEQCCDFKSDQQFWDWVHYMAALMPFGYITLNSFDVPLTEMRGVEDQYPRLLHAVLAHFADDRGFVSIRDNHSINSLEAPVLGEFYGILLDQGSKEFNFCGTMSDPVDALASAQQYDKYIDYMRDISQSLDDLRGYIFNSIQSACIDVFFEQNLEVPFMEQVEQIKTLATKYEQTATVEQRCALLFQMEESVNLNATGICRDLFVQTIFQAFKDNVIATLIEGDTDVQALCEQLKLNCIERLNRPEILEIEVSIERSLSQMRAYFKDSPYKICTFDTSAAEYLINFDSRQHHDEYHRDILIFKRDFALKLASIFGIPVSDLQSYGACLHLLFSSNRRGDLFADHFGLRGNADDFLQSDSTQSQGRSFEGRKICYRILRRCVEGILLKMPEIAVLKVLCANQQGISPKVLTLLFKELGLLVEGYKDQAADPSIAHRAHLNEVMITQFESIASCQVDEPTRDQVRGLTQSIEHLSDEYLDQITAYTAPRAMDSKLSLKAAEYVRDIALVAEKAGELNASNLMVLLQNLIGYQLYIVEAKHLQPEEVIIAQQACESLLCSIRNFCKHQDITAIRFDDIEVLLNLSVTNKSMFTVLFESFVMYADKEVRTGASRPLFQNLIDYIRYYSVMSEPKETVKDAVAFLQPTQLSKIEKIELLAFFSSQLTDADRLMPGIESAVSALDVAARTQEDTTTPAFSSQLTDADRLMPGIESAVSALDVAARTQEDTTTPAYVERLKEILGGVDCLVSQHPHIKGPLVAMLFNIKSDGASYIDTVSDYLSVLETLIESDGLSDAHIYTYLALHQKCPKMLIDFLKEMVMTDSEPDSEPEPEPDFEPDSEPEPEPDFEPEPEPESRSMIEGRCLAVLQYTESQLSRVSSEEKGYQDEIERRHKEAKALLAAFSNDATGKKALAWFRSCCLQPPYMEHDHLIHVITHFTDANSASDTHYQQTISEGMKYKVSKDFCDITEEPLGYLETHVNFSTRLWLCIVIRRWLQTTRSKPGQCFFSCCVI